MSKTTLGILAVVVAALAVAAAILIQFRPVKGLAPVAVTISTDGTSCVQSVGGSETLLVSVKNGQAVAYSSAEGHVFAITFPPGGIISTGSPFLKDGSYQTPIVANGQPTGPSNLTFLESAAIFLGFSSAANFSYQSISVDGNPCKTVQGTGVHVTK